MSGDFERRKAHREMILSGALGNDAKDRMLREDAMLQNLFKDVPVTTILSRREMLEQTLREAKREVALCAGLQPLPPGRDGGEHG